MSDEAQYPEHDKLSKVKDESQAIGEFLDFGLSRLGLTLCERQGSRFFPTHKTITTILAEHFGIDQNVLEDEKRAMLEEVRLGHVQRDRIEYLTGGAT